MLPCLEGWHGVESEFRREAAYGISGVIECLGGIVVVVICVSRNRTWRNVVISLHHGCGRGEVEANVPVCDAAGRVTQRPGVVEDRFEENIEEELLVLGYDERDYRGWGYLINELQAELNLVVAYPHRHRGVVICKTNLVLRFSLDIG